MATISVLLIGDEDRRDLVKAALRGDRALALVGEIADGPVLGLVAQLGVDVIILDFAATHVNSLTALSSLQRQAAGAAIVVLGVDGTATEQAVAQALGAAAYAPGLDPAAIQGALQDALARHRPVPAAQAA